MKKMFPFTPIPGSVFLLVFLCLPAIWTCTPTEQTQVRAIDQPANAHSNWSAILKLSGGFAGQMREIHVDQTGQATLTDKKLNTRFEKQVTPQELQNIAKLVTLLPVDLPPDQRSSQCRDCITYTLVTRVNGAKQTLVTDDSKLHDSGAKDLIRSLATLASGMLKK